MNGLSGNVRLLILGGELNNPGYGRTNGCEIYDPRSNSWTNTGSFNLPTEIPPAILLYTGEMLKTWPYPELYKPHDYDTDFPSDRALWIH